MRKSSPSKWWDRQSGLETSLLLFVKGGWRVGEGIVGSHCLGQILILLGLVFHQVDTVSSDQSVHVRTERMSGKFLTSTKRWQLRCLCVDFGLFSCQASDGGPGHVYIMNKGRRDKNMSLRLLEGSVYPSRVGDRIKKTLQGDSKGQPVSRFTGFLAWGNRLTGQWPYFHSTLFLSFRIQLAKFPFLPGLCASRLLLCLCFGSELLLTLLHSLPVVPSIPEQKWTCLKDVPAGKNCTTALEPCAMCRMSRLSAAPGSCTHHLSVVDTSRAGWASQWLADWLREPPIPRKCPENTALKSNASLSTSSSISPQNTIRSPPRSLPPT